MYEPLPHSRCSCSYFRISWFTIFAVSEKSIGDGFKKIRNCFHREILEYNTISHFLKHLEVWLFVGNGFHVVNVKVSNCAISNKPVAEMTTSATSTIVAPEKNRSLIFGRCFLVACIPNIALLPDIPNKWFAAPGRLGSFIIEEPDPDQEEEEDPLD